MNKNHRVVWSAHRQAFIVAHEAASSRGPGPSPVAVSTVAKAVAALALSAASLHASAACPAASGGIITVNTPITFGCELANGDSIVITSAGSVESSTAVYANGVGSIGGSIQNAGTIRGTSDTAIDIYNGAEIASITNTGEIIGYSYGIIVAANSAITGGVTNSGLITGDSYGFRLDGGTIGGGIDNSGSVYGGYHAIHANSGALINGINNSGTMTASTSSIIYIEGSTVTGGFTNSGTITGTVSGYDQAAIRLANSSTLSGGFTNTGVIDYTGTSEHAYGLRLQSSSLSGGITNSGTLRVAAPSQTEAAGIRLQGSSISGGITNSGLIQAGDASTYESYGLSGYMSTISGDIVNTGTWTGTGSNEAYGIYLIYSSVSGGITNSGTLSGTTAGISLFGSSVSAVIGGPIVNQAGGTISGDFAGIMLNAEATVTGGIQNAGVIRGTMESVSLANFFAPFAIDNTGTLGGNANIGINTLNLNGNSARVIGSTAGSGTVNINGTFSSEGVFDVGTFNVASTGVFFMNHEVGATSGATNSGILDVGEGSRTITGDFTQAPSGTFRLALANESTHGRLNVSGNATVADGSKIFVNIVGAPTLSNNATIAGVITTEGTLTTNASALSVNDNSALYKFAAATVSSPGSALDLIVTPDSAGLPSAVETNRLPAAAGAAGALQTMFNNGVPQAMAPVFEKLNNMTDEEAAQAVSQTLPTLVGAGSQAGINALHSMNKIIQSRVESVQGLSSGEVGADRYAWVRAFGNWSDQNNRRDVAGFESDTGGIVIGADAPVNDKVRAGGAFTYAKSKIKSKSDAAPSKVDVDTFELVGYASYNIDPRTDINYQLDIGQNKASSTREITFMGTRATADFDSIVVHGSVGIGRLMPISETTNWTPSVRLDYTHMRTEGYTEDGAGPLNLDVKSQTYREFLLTGDAKASHQFQNGLKLLGNASLGYDFVNKQAKSTSTFTGGGPTFVTEGLDVSPWFYRLGAGLVKETGKGMEYSLRYDMEGRTSGYINQSVSAKVRWAF